MPTLGLYYSDRFTQAEVNALRSRLNAMAGSFGYIAHRGPTTGQGNLAELLIAIDSGEVALVLLPDEQRSAMVDFLRQVAADSQQSALVTEAAESIAQALEQAIEREEIEMIPETRDLIQQLETEYYAAIAANPDWDALCLFDYLTQRGIKGDDIWQYSPQIGYDANQPEPDWL